MPKKQRIERTSGYRVRLPDGLRSPFEVYLNGVKQELGTDFRVSAGELVFTKELVKERLSGGAWFMGAWGIGTYKRDDSVDVRYEIKGRPTVAQGLTIIPDSKPAPG